MALMEIGKQAEFRRHVKACLVKAEVKYGVYFGRVTITFDLKGYSAGEARICPHPTLGKVFKLRFNKEALEKNWDGMVNSTIPHEVAHLVVFARPDLKSENHDYKWRAIAISLGDVERGAVYHTMVLKPARRPKVRNPVSALKKVKEKYRRD